MNIDDAGHIGSASDVLNKAELFGIIIKIISPVLIVLVSLILIKYILKYYKYWSKNRKIEKEQQEEKKKQQEKQQKKKDQLLRKRKQKINKVFNDKELLLNQLNDLKEPQDTERFKSLYVSFDKDGKAIKQ
jgi:mannitol-specific phosphotransferase system IIBC component